MSPHTTPASTIFTLPDFPLEVRPISRHGMTELHGHDFEELVVITGGSGTHSTGNEHYPVSRGDVFTIARNRSHAYNDTRDLALVNILFDRKHLALPLYDLANIPGYHVLFRLEPAWRAKHKFESRLRLPAKELSHVEGMIHNLLAELNGKQPGFKFLAVSSLMQIIGYLSRCYRHHSKESSAVALFRIGQAISHIEANYAEPVQLAKLAGIAHMSVRAFLRAFNEAMDSSPIDYLVRLRIARASQLLRKAPHLNITEIAFRTGFRDSNYFARKFRDTMGVSPREYRNGKMAMTTSRPG